MNIKRIGLTSLPMFIGANALQAFTETEGTEDEKLQVLFQTVDADLAAHFCPAERLDTLLAAVERWMVDPMYAEAIRNLAAAFRAFREQVSA